MRQLPLAATAGLAGAAATGLAGEAATGFAAGGLAAGGLAAGGLAAATLGGADAEAAGFLADAMAWARSTPFCRCSRGMTASMSARVALAAASPWAAARLT